MCYTIHNIIQNRLFTIPNTCSDETRVQTSARHTRKRCNARKVFMDKTLFGKKLNCAFFDTSTL